eukprot:1156378-Pelagomonas_calceolata.AAC.6
MRLSKSHHQSDAVLKLSVLLVETHKFDTSELSSRLSVDIYTSLVCCEGACTVASQQWDGRELGTTWMWTAFHELLLDTQAPGTASRKRKHIISCFCAQSHGASDALHPDGERTVCMAMVRDPFDIELPRYAHGGGLIVPFVAIELQEGMRLSSNIALEAQAPAAELLPCLISKLIQRHLRVYTTNAIVHISVHTMYHCVYAASTHDMPKMDGSAAERLQGRLLRGNPGERLPLDPVGRSKVSLHDYAPMRTLYHRLFPCT